MSNAFRVILKSPDGVTELTVAVEIADDPAERARGLMERDHLDVNMGMLFIFEQPQDLSFWMKDTRIPIDILFFDAEGKFISTTTMTPCEGDPCPGYPSGGKAKYALEVNAGFVSNHQIGRGWTLQR